MAHSKFNRRKFAKRMIMGTMAIPIGTATAALSRAEEPKGDVAKSEKPVERPEFPRPISSDESFLAIVMLRYPDERLDEKTLTSIRIEIARNCERSRQLGS